MNSFNAFREGRFLMVVNMTLMVWCMVTLPLHYFLDFRIMSPIMYSCAVCLLLCLLQYLAFKSGKLLLIAVVIFLLHAISCT